MVELRNINKSEFYFMGRIQLGIAMPEAKLTVFANGHVYAVCPNPERAP